MALREILARFDIDTSGLAKGAAEGKSAIGGLTSSLKSMAGLFAGGAVLNGIRNMVDGLVNQGSALADASAQLGISTDALQDWQFAAKLNGLEAEGFNASLKILQRNMSTAGERGAQSGGKFRELGVQVRDAKGEMRSTTDVLYDTGLAISKLKSPAERTQAALEVFGKAGSKLVPLFADGEEGLRKYLAELKNAGGGIPSDAIEKLDEYGDQMDRFDVAMTSAKVSIVSQFLPGITSMLSSLTKGIASFSQTKSGAATLQAGVIALGAAGAAAGLTFIAPWLPGIVVFGGLALLIQDFIVGLKGGDSEIGHIMDQLFGEGSGESFFVKVKDDAQKLFEAAKELYDFITGKDRGNTNAADQRIAEASAATSEQQIANAPKNAIVENAAAIFGFKMDGLYESLAKQILRERDAADAEAQGDGRRRARTFDTEAPLFETDPGQRARSEAVDKADVASITADLIAGLPPALAGFATTYGADGKLFQPAATADAKGGDQTITQTNSTNITINAESDDPEALAGATADATAAAHRTALEGLKKVGAAKK